MPRLDDNTQQTLRDAEQGIRRRAVDAWDSFSNFALRDNVLEVAVGLMYSALSPPSPFPRPCILYCKDWKARKKIRQSFPPPSLPMTA